VRLNRHIFRNWFNLVFI